MRNSSFQGPVVYRHLEEVNHETLPFQGASQTVHLQHHFRQSR